MTTETNNVHAFFQMGARWEEIQGNHYAHCVICAAKVSGTARHVYVDIKVGQFVTAAADTPDADGIVKWPIGSNCLRSYPELRPYLAD